MSSLIPQSKFEPADVPLEEIVTTLAQSNIADISLSDLSNPQPELMFALYTKILHDIGTLQEDLGEVDFEALEHLENPEHHAESFPKVNLFRKMREVLAALKCPMIFTLKDLLRPEAKRTWRFLSCLINFCYFRDAKIELLRPIMDECSLLDNQRREHEDKISRMSREIGDYEEARKTEVSLVQEEEVNIKELSESNSSLNNRQMSLRCSYRAMKEESGVLDEKISRAEFSLMQSLQENADLRSQIVQSPEKLQRALEEKKLLLAEVKKAERNAMQSYQERTNSVEVYTQAFKKTVKRFSEVKALAEQMSTAKSMEDKVKALKVKLSNDELVNKSLEVELMQLQDTGEKMKVARNHVEKECGLKYEEASKEMERIKGDVESRTSDVRKRESNVASVLAEVDARTEAIETVEESGMRKERELHLQAEQLSTTFDGYMGSLDDALLLVLHRRLPN